MTKFREITDADVALLQLFRLVRNVIHSNGIHRPPSHSSTKVTYHGESFVFVDGKQLDFVNWELVLQISEDVVEMLVRVVTNAQIQGHALPIPELRTA